MQTIKDIMEIICKQPRTSGTLYNTEISRYLNQKLVDIGYEVLIDTHPFTGWEQSREPEVKITKPIIKDVKCLPVVWGGTTNGKHLQGKVVPFFKTIKTFEAYDFQCFSIVDNNGKVSGCLLTRPDSVWPQPLDRADNNLPYILVDTETCYLINRWIHEKTAIEVDFMTDCKYVEGATINNVIGLGNDRKVLLCAHYDSFMGTVGANDNASGVACLLSLANELRKKKTCDPTICFFDAEEWNKYGSYMYVDKEKKAGRLNNIKLVMNIDSLGAAGDLYFLCSKGIEKTINELTEKAKEKIKIDFNIEVSSSPAIPQFDVWPFMLNGCEVVQIGSRSNPPFKHWHSPLDNISGVDFEFIEKARDVLVEIATQYQKQEG